MVEASVREAVQEKYDEIARTRGKSGCCGTTACGGGDSCERRENCDREDMAALHQWSMGWCGGR